MMHTDPVVLNLMILVYRETKKNGLAGLGKSEILSRINPFKTGNSGEWPDVFDRYK